LGVPGNARVSSSAFASDGWGQRYGTERSERKDAHWEGLRVRCPGGRGTGRRGGRPGASSLRSGEPSWGSAMSPNQLSDEVYKALSARMVRLARRLGVPQDLCDDVVQEAWVHAFVQAKDFSGERALAELLAWFRVLVHNVAVDMLRGLGRHGAVSLEALSAEPLDQGEVNRVEFMAWAECLTVWLERLGQEAPENCRLFCEHYLEGRTLSELAAEAGRTVNEISCRIYRVMQKLRRCAAEWTRQGRGDCR
jgi:RNA polymerase sigma factor (sigma-70 family)